MKNTALTQKHIALGAKMVPFAGYNMPVQYEGVNAEHETVRNGVGVFDVSHMGEFLLKGPKALDLIQKVCSNDASVLFDGKAQYSCLPNGKGGIIDDLIIYRVNAQEYFIVVNASNIEKDWNWIASHNDLGVEMKNLSNDYSLLAIQGPKAALAMQALTNIDLSDMTYYTFQYGTFAGIENVMVRQLVTPVQEVLKYMSKMSTPPNSGMQFLKRVLHSVSNQLALLPATPFA